MARNSSLIPPFRHVHHLDNCQIKMVRVAVIGGGPAGIFTAGALGESCEVTIYEQGVKFGGQWVYAETDEDDFGYQHSWYAIRK